MDATVANYIANEARKTELRNKLAGLAGQQTALGSLARAISSQGNDLQKIIASVQADLAAVESGAGPGISDDFGPYSTTDQAMHAEREAGKNALIDYVKANPTCTEQDVAAQWRVAALAARPADRQWLLQDPLALRQEYSANLMHYTDDAGQVHQYVPDMTWESFRAFIIATDKLVLMAL